MHPDLHATRLAIEAGTSDARTEIEHAIAAAQSPANRHTFTRALFDEARREAATAEHTLPLAGLAFSVKDLFDVASQPTPAGSVDLTHA
ncbi:MAG: amidase family protein, partial [Variovorax sp.]